jgi:FKBP-type peptidyl-prolyl cis-trans isomerase FkpA
MKINQLSILAIIGGVIAFSSCEPSNPYNTGPQYDVIGNLALDSVKIENYLDTAKIDSLYRIHDATGVIIIVQEEGLGSRPNNGNIIYTDFAGSLLLDGSVFDTNIAQVAINNDIFDEANKYQTLSFVLGSGSVIPGWDIAFKRIRSGTKAKIIIPSPFGYQDQDNKEAIPANSVLVFDVEFKGLD